jgi:hypothetical protein
LLQNIISMNLYKCLSVACRASGAYLLRSFLVAAFVFELWYPFPYRELTGGRELFLLVMAVVGSRVIANCAPKENAEMMKSLDFSIQGNEPTLRLHWWQQREMSRADAVKRAKPCSALRKLHMSKPESIARIHTAVKESGNSEEALGWLLWTSQRHKDVNVWVDAQTAAPLAYVAADGPLTGA